MPEIKQAFSIPAAIVIAGALIAGGIYFSKVGPAPVAPAAQVAQQATPGPLPDHFDIRAISDADHIMGDKNAPVTLIEYSDLECPFCKIAHNTLKQLMANNAGKVRLVYRHGLSVHQQTTQEAIAAECASAQGKFWEFTDTIFSNTPSNDGLNLADLPKYAQEAGVADISAFQSCIKDAPYGNVVQADEDELVAVEKVMSAAGQQVGTPFFILIGKDGKQTPIIGAQPYATFQQAIDSALN
ncbi:MAG: DsbA family protein [Candidatus Andersenbacteria bacterium]|nr:DsbA family protein [Candidatus Andersenbacteria bacterium]